jgi:hypothetical protein
VPEHVERFKQTLDQSVLPADAADNVKWNGINVAPDLRNHLRRFFVWKEFLWITGLLERCTLHNTRLKLKKNQSARDMPVARVVHTHATALSVGIATIAV